MASFPRDKGPYHRVIFDHRINGERRTKTFYFKKSEFNRSEVGNWKKARELEYKARTWDPWGQPNHIEREGSTLLDAVNTYTTRAAKELAPTTYEIRRRYLEIFSQYVGAGKPLSAVTAADCNNWINEPGLTFPTRKNRLKTLQVFYKWAAREHQIKMEGLEVIARQSEKKKYYNKQHKAFITEAHLHKILHHVTRRTRYDRDRLLDFYRLAFYTTRRRSDLLNLRPSWIFEDEPYMRVGDEHYLPKSQIIEYVPLLESAWEILLKYKSGPDRPIFRFRPDYVTKQFQAALESAYPKMKGLVSLHNLRDSGIMYLIYEKNLDLKHVMSMTGHRTLRSLELYTHSWAEKTLQEVRGM